MLSKVCSATIVCALIAACTTGRARPPAPVAQNPSPMVERSRAHGRLSPGEVALSRHTLNGVLPRPIELFIPAAAARTPRPPLLVHFLGASFIPIEAAMRSDSTMVVAIVNLSPGSAAYEAPFRESGTWRRLLGAVDSLLAAQTGQSIRHGTVYLSAFSAGNGAVRAIIADSSAAAEVAGVIVLDGIHTSYVPEGRVVAQGGALEPAPLQALLRYARRAMNGEVRMLITHSEIFPGTFASTTETANWLLDALGLARTPTLEWGPLGMQQTSAAGRGRLGLLGFAGNSAPDHVDHLHALPWFLAAMRER